MADIEVAPGGSYETSMDWGVTGLVGTIGIRLLDGNGATTVARVTAGITEYPATSGVYWFTRTAPTTAGDYDEFWDNGAVTVGNSQLGDRVTVTSSAVSAATPGGRDLCALADVTRLVPGYTSDADTDALLTVFISAESRTAHQQYGREFVTIAGATTRSFDVDARMVRQRRVAVGDMTSVTTVTIKDVQGATVETVASADYVKVGDEENRTREEWEPITELWFPSSSASPAALSDGCVLEVVGVWGFPSLPSDIVVATAKLVLVRYVADATSAGSALSDALNEQGFDAGVAFVSAREVFRSYQQTKFA